MKHRVYELGIVETILLFIIVSAAGYDLWSTLIYVFKYLWGKL